MIPNATTVKIGEDLEVQTAAEAPSRTYKIDFDAAVSAASATKRKP